MDEFNKVVEDVWNDKSPSEYDQSSGALNNNLEGAFGKLTLDDESQVKDNHSDQAQNKDCDEALGHIMLAETSQFKHHQFLSVVKELMLCGNTKPKCSSLDIALQMYVVKAINDNDPSLSLRLFEIGISPDFFTQHVPYIDASLLEEAVHKQSYDVIKVLIDNDVNINYATEGRGYFYCKSIMYSVLQHDNPKLMELFLPKYYRGWNLEGKSLLYMACRLGAFKCAEVLLQRHRGDTNLAEISFRDDMKNKAMIISLLCQTEGAVYTPDDLGYCLKEAVDSRNASLLYNQYKGDRIDYINLLLSCGANVNLNSELPSSRGNFTLLEELIFPTSSPQFHRFSLSFVEKALSLLLSHGCIAKWPHVNICLSYDFFEVISKHDEEMKLFVLMIMSNLYSKEHFKQIKGPMVNCEIGQRSSEWSTLLQEEVRHVSSKNEQKNDCKLNPEIIRLAILYLDINVLPFLSCYHSYMQRKCRCLKYFLNLVASTLKDLDYQKFIKVLNANQYRYPWFKVVQFSDMRSLRERTRATILSSLCLPRSFSIEELPLTHRLQEYLCLKY